VESIGSRRVVDSTRAAVVVQIFEMYAGGLSYRNIAKALNAEHVPTVRPALRPEIRELVPDMIRVLLRNELYIGLVI
jgi:hypothetical protein